ncbi:MAG TPA: response regulator [Bacteroidia bacterium]|nr:response regulator [Bacteroidia bacterium]
MKAPVILIVDDDHEDRELLEEAIHEIDSSIKCRTATDGREALALLQNMDDAPDMIFLDLNMPKINGKQCLNEIKKTERFNTVPVIIYTTSKLSEDIAETRNMGASCFITKPNTYRELRTSIVSLISNLKSPKNREPEFAVLTSTLFH